MNRTYLLIVPLTVAFLLAGAVSRLNAQATLVNTYQTDQIIHDIAFRNADDGYAIVDEHVLVTHDGGATWERTMPLVFRPYFRSIALFGESGIIIGDMYGGVHITTNSEFEWKSVQLDGGNVSIETPPVVEVQAVNGAHWVVITDSAIYTTRDSGVSFTVFKPSNRNATLVSLDITASDPSIMHVCETAFEVFRSTDGGDTWNDLQIPPNGFGHLYDVHFISRDTGFVANWYPWNLFTTVDGGETWTTGPFEYPTSIAIAPGGTGAYTTPKYLRVTQDRGMNWSDTISLPRLKNEQFFPDAEYQKLVVAGQNRIFLLMTNTDVQKSVIARIDATSGVEQETSLVPSDIDLVLSRFDF